MSLTLIKIYKIQPKLLVILVIMNLQLGIKKPWDASSMKQRENDLYVHLTIDENKLYKQYP